MGDPREALEAMLHERWWDTETLRIYADLLTSSGDPRGEMIMLDLHAGDEPAPELVARRNELYSTWLGVDITSERFRGVRLRHGFVEISSQDPDTVESILAGPGGAFVRTVMCNGSAQVLEHALACVSRAPRPWLRDLSLHRFDTGPDPALSAGAIAALIAATPGLTKLDVAGPRVVARFDHPGVRALSIVDADSIMTLFAAYGTALPAVESLTLFCSPAGRSPDLAKLRRLTMHDPLGHCSDWPPFLEQLDQIAQLTDLAIPVLRSADQVDQLQSVLDRMPALQRLRVIEAYERFGELGDSLHHPSAVIDLPPIWPWPPPDLVDPAANMQVFAGGKRIGAHLGIYRLIEHVYRVYDKLDDAGRAEWDVLWRAVAGLEHQREVAVPAATFASVLDTLPRDSFIRSDQPYVALELELRRPGLPSMLALRRSRY